MSLQERLARAVFKGPHSREVTYTPVGGSVITIRAVIDEREEVRDELAVVPRRFAIRVRSVDVPSPQKGDLIAWGTVTREVIAAPVKIDGLGLTLELDTKAV